MTKLENIVDPGLSEEGLRRMTWARRFMPALADAGRDLVESGAITGRRVGIVLMLEPKTANLAITLADAGAEVSVYCDASSTTDSIAAALVSRGIRVYARSDADSAADAILLDRFIDDHPEILIDDGAHCTRLIHTKRRDALKSLVGVAEETTSGVRPLRVMQEMGELEVPCVAVDEGRAKRLFDNVFGTGQSVLMSIVDTTNTQIQGKNFVVIGYGHVGRGIAKYVTALGGNVVVTEIDPVRALEAIHEGHEVMTLTTACPTGDFFVTATGIGHSLTAEHVKLMKDGAILAVGGSGQPEIDLSGDASVVLGAESRRNVREVRVEGARSVFLIAEGHCSNIAAGEGNPIEIMDMSLAVQCRVVRYLAESDNLLSIAVHDVPASIDDLVVRSVLSSRGVEIDTPSPAQHAHATSWNMTENKGD